MTLKDMLTTKFILPRWMLWLIAIVTPLPDLTGLFFILCFELGAWMARINKRRDRRAHR